MLPWLKLNVFKVSYFFDLWSIDFCRSVLLLLSSFSFLLIRARCCDGGEDQTHVVEDQCSRLEQRMKVLEEARDDERANWALVERAKECLEQDL